jgi:TonB family protein
MELVSSLASPLASPLSPLAPLGGNAEALNPSLEPSPGACVAQQLTYGGRRVTLYPRRRLLSPTEMRQQYDRPRHLPWLLALSTVAQGVPLGWVVAQQGGVNLEPGAKAQPDRPLSWVELQPSPPSVAPVPDRQAPESSPPRSAAAGSHSQGSQPGGSSSGAGSVATVSQGGSPGKAAIAPARQPSPSPGHGTTRSPQPAAPRVAPQPNPASAPPATKAPLSNPGPGASPTTGAGEGSGGSGAGSGAGFGNGLESGLGGTPRSSLNPTAQPLRAASVAPGAQTMVQQPWPFARTPQAMPERFAPASQAESPGIGGGDGEKSHGGKGGSPRATGSPSRTGSAPGSALGSPGRSATGLSSGSAMGSGSGSGLGSGTGSGVGSGVGTGSGTGSGLGSGTGSGSGSGSGSGGGSGSGSGQKTAQTVSPGTFDVGPYLRNVKQQVDRQWHSGPEQRSRVVVVFSLGRSGEIVNLGLSHSSGNPAADRAALAAVQQAAPQFGPLPSGYDEQSLRVELTLIQE